MLAVLSISWSITATFLVRLRAKEIRPALGKAIFGAEVLTVGSVGLMIAIRAGVTPERLDRVALFAIVLLPIAAIASTIWIHKKS